MSNATRTEVTRTAECEHDSDQFCDTCLVEEVTVEDTEAAKRAEEDAVWEARGRMAAREQVAQQVANLDDATLDLIRESAHADRRNLVNLYIGENRKERIAETDLIIGVIEEEQAKRAGFASSDDLISALGGFEFVEVQDADNLATLLDYRPSL